MSKVALLQKIGEEYDTAKVNRVAEEYESYIDLLDSERGEKDYDWMSEFESDVEPHEAVSEFLCNLDINSF